MKYLSVSEFAAARAVSSSRVSRWLQQGRLAGAQKIGARWRIPAQADPGVLAVGRPRRQRPLPAALSEADLLELCATAPDLEAWRRAGPPALMAGLAVLVAGISGFERSAYLQMAQQLDATVATVGGFARWLKQAPLQPAHFLPRLRRLRAKLRRAELAAPTRSRAPRS